MIIITGGSVSPVTVLQNYHHHRGGSVSPVTVLRNDHHHGGIGVSLSNLLSPLL